MISAYELGIKAFNEGLLRFDNPYKGPEYKEQWDDGWLDAYYDHYGYY